MVGAMNWARVLENYQATEGELQAYVETLPLWVNVWRGWMFFVFTVAVVFVLSKREARWLGLTLVVSIVAYNLVAGSCGPGRFPSIAFVLLWSPLAVYFARRLPQIESVSRFDAVYSWWFRAALGTLVISLAFDTYNVAYSLIAGVP